MQSIEDGVRQENHVLLLVVGHLYFFDVHIYSCFQIFLESLKMKVYSIGFYKKKERKVCRCRNKVLKINKYTETSKIFTHKLQNIN